MQLTALARLTALTRSGVAALGQGILQPIVIVSPTTGAVFVNAEGKVLTRGVRRVKPQES